MRATVGCLGFALAFSAVTAGQNANVIVPTQSGPVRGVIEGDIRVFRGIPFAAPPVGDLRWYPPAPPIPWTGIRDASTFGNVCPEIDYNGNLVGNEDCLVLNIYTAANLDPRAEQPVMVFFHGGGDITGSSQVAPYGSPPPLATHGVIVVTAEYRVGALGFFVHPLLAIEGRGSTGNYGLMDHLAALAWVQRNIRAFGGDPERVMAFGQSAGASNVEILLASPAARGLFSRAGVESDASPLKGTPSLQAAEAAHAPLVALVGCANAADVLKCLRSVPASVLVTNQASVPIATFVLEPRVLPEDPFIVLQRDGSPVPLLIGSTSEEATGLALPFDPSLTAAQYVDAVHADYAFLGAGVPDQSLAVYPASAYDSPFWALVAVDSDVNITCEVREAAQTSIGPRLEHDHPPVWRYLFTHRVENDPNLNALRAFHTEELYFVFGNLATLSNPYVPSADELQLSNLLMDYWTRFAAKGDPNGPHSLHWPRYSARDHILKLDVAPAYLHGYHNPQCDFFEPIIDTYCSENICEP
jgi:para-nitrobenzyl esterase